jgi:hypothetical protein
MGTDERTAEQRTPEPSFTMRDSDEADGQQILTGTDFSTFVLSLGTSAFYHLGLTSDPDRDQPPKTLDESDRMIARQTIGTLEMIAEKTRGNLQPDEEKLLESILFELRTRYVAVQK